MVFESRIARAQWQVSPKANVNLGFEFAGSGDLPLDQNRGPLAGRVSGTATSNLHFFTANPSWNF
jgi:hypothetical protein